MQAPRHHRQRAHEWQRAREQESKRAREQESKREAVIAAESKWQRAREQESKREAVNCIEQERGCHRRRSPFIPTTACTNYAARKRGCTLRGCGTWRRPCRRQQRSLRGGGGAGDLRAMAPSDASTPPPRSTRPGDARVSGRVNA